MPRVLLLSDDDALLEELVRLSAAAGCEADVGRDPTLVRARWRMATVVLLGTDLLPACRAAGLPRREGCFLVGREPLPPDIWVGAVEVGAERVLNLPDADEALVDLLGEAVSGRSEAGQLIAVVGGCGGAGTSVLAAGLAVTAARAGHRVLAVDADPWGGGSDLLYGAEDTPGLRWPDLAALSGRVAANALHQALPRSHGVAILSQDRAGADLAPAALLAVCRSGRRAGDVVVADVGQPLAPAADALGEADDVLLVVPARVRACAAAGRVATDLARLSGRTRVVVRRGRHDEVPPDAVAEALGLPLGAVLRDEPGLTAALEHGEPPASRRRGSLAASCRQLLGSGRSTVVRAA